MLDYSVAQLNSPFDDSVFFVRNVYKKKSFLLDCGRLGGLDHAALLSLRDIFVTHTHMDHFFGFDRVLRGSLIGDHSLRVYGPVGFIDNIKGKLAGYSWNLIQDYSFSIEAIELLANNKHKKAIFKSTNSFIPEYVREADGTSFDIDDGFTMEYELFEHDIPVAGYKIIEPLQFAILQDKLDNLGYKPGPWLAKLKKALVAGVNDDITAMMADGSAVTKSAKAFAKEFVERKERESVVYITDIAPTDDNIEKAIKFATGASLLIIEGVFLDADMEHAKFKKHLNIGNSKRIFAESGAKYVRFAHFASKYEQDKRSFYNELYSGLDGKIYNTNK